MLFSRLVPLERVLRLRGLIVSWRAVRITVEIFYARHFGKFSVSSFAANLAPRTLQFTVEWPQAW